MPSISDEIRERSEKAGRVTGHMFGNWVCVNAKDCPRGLSHCDNTNFTCRSFGGVENWKNVGAGKMEAPIIKCYEAPDAAPDLVEWVQANGKDRQRKKWWLG